MRIDADTGCLAAFSGKVNAGAVLSFLGKYCNAIVRLQTELGCLKLYVLLNLNIQWTLHEHLILLTSKPTKVLAKRHSLVKYNKTSMYITRDAVII